MVDWVIAAVVAEAALLLAYHRLTGRGPGMAKLLPTLAAGGFLLLAMRAALGGAAWPLVSACLLGGLASHLWDLRQRWHD